MDNEKLILKFKTLRTVIGNNNKDLSLAYLDEIESMLNIEKQRIESQLSLKIINCIKSHLCKQDEDYDTPIISPKFLSDVLDQMVIDGFEEDVKYGPDEM